MHGIQKVPEFLESGSLSGGTQILGSLSLMIRNFLKDEMGVAQTPVEFANVKGVCYVHVCVCLRGGSPSCRNVYGYLCVVACIYVCE